MTEATTYSTVEDNAQTTLHSILSNNSAVTAYTPNIYDGHPTTLAKGIGFPYIIIHTPPVEEELPVFSGTISEVDAIASIVVYDRIESHVRKLGGVIRGALRDARSTLETEAKLHLYGSGIRSVLTREFLDTGGAPERSVSVWVYTIRIPLKFVG